VHSSKTGHGDVAAEIEGWKPDWRPERGLPDCQVAVLGTQRTAWSEAGFDGESHCRFGACQCGASLLVYRPTHRCSIQRMLQSRQHRVEHMTAERGQRLILAPFWYRHRRRRCFRAQPAIRVSSLILMIDEGPELARVVQLVDQMYGSERRFVHGHAVVLP